MKEKKLRGVAKPADPVRESCPKAPCCAMLVGSSPAFPASGIFRRRHFGGPAAFNLHKRRQGRTMLRPFAGATTSQRVNE